MIVPKLICHVPVVGQNLDLVEITFVTKAGTPVEQIVMTPHAALALAERIGQQALAILGNAGGAEVVEFRAIEGH